jgi:hypothetical protein
MDLCAGISFDFSESSTLAIGNSRMKQSERSAQAGCADLLSLALDVVEIASRFASRLHPFSEVLARALETPLSHGLQLGKLALLRIKLSRSEKRKVSVDPIL